MKSVTKIVLLFAPLTLITLYGLWKIEKKTEEQNQLQSISNKTADGNKTNTPATSEIPPTNPQNANVIDENKALHEFIQLRDTHSKDNLWDDIDKLIADYEPKFKELKQRFTLIKSDILKKKGEAESAFNNYLEMAKQYIAESKFYEAALAIKNAAANYPSKHDEAMSLIEEIKKRLIKNMIEIPETIVTLNIEEGKPSSLKVQGFKISKYEITNIQYACFVLISGHTPPPYWQRNLPPKGFDDYPVFYINYYDALKFTEWIGKRLPTEHEWEAACSYNDNRKYPWGNEYFQKDDESPAISIEHCEAIGKFTPVPVGTKSTGKSMLEIFDLSGNVWEWTSSSTDANNETLYILKGGSFMTYKEALLCANKLAEHPAMKHIDVGFRVAESIPVSK